MRLATLRLNARRVAYRESGAGPAVVLVPGLGLTGRFYDASFPVFAGAGLRLIVPDPPGFGGSEPDPDARDVPGLAGWLAAFAHRLELARPAWIGHSVSAQICAELAARRPDLASALVLVAPTGLTREPVLPRQALGLARETLRTPVSVVRAVATDYLRTSPLRYLRLWRGAGRHRLLDAAARVRCPTLVLLGTDDRVVARGDVGALLRCLAEGRWIAVSGIGHGLPREAPEAMHAAALPFLTSGLGQQNHRRGPRRAGTGR